MKATKESPGIIVPCTKCKENTHISFNDAKELIVVEDRFQNDIYVKCQNNNCGADILAPSWLQEILGSRIAYNL